LSRDLKRVGDGAHRANDYQEREANLGAAHQVLRIRYWNKPVLMARFKEFFFALANVINR
jgi:hypothetical protein